MNVALSPRFRYRYLPKLAWGVGGLAAVGIVAAGAVLLFPSKDQTTDPGRLTSQPAQVVHEDTTNYPVAAPVPGIARRFVRTTVTRQKLAVGWTLLAPCGKGTLPCLHDGISRKQWLAGDIPVVPYPAYGGVKYRVGYSHKRDVLLEVAVFPRRGSTIRPMVFDIGMHLYGKRWLVNYWAPRGQSFVPSN